MSARHRVAGVLLALCAWDASAAHAQSNADLRIELDGWSGDRRGNDKGPLVNAEAWLKADGAIADNLSYRFEGWAATNPRGDYTPAGDIRDAYVEADLAGVKLRAGRQVFAWGRADRINPTDTLAARDNTRLGESEDDNRLGLAALTLTAPLAGGDLSLIWQPEFRATRLPYTLGPRTAHHIPHRQSYAARYERFGAGTDFALTITHGPDRTAWIRPGLVMGQPGLIMLHPVVTTLGGDVAVNIGKFSLRVEAARSWHDKAALAGMTTAIPEFAAVVGLDRSLRGNWMVIVQGLVRTASTTGAAANPLGARNATLHGAWRKTILGASASIRKSFAAERIHTELTGAWLEGGGRFAQLRASFAVSQSIVLRLLAERFAGGSTTYFGRLKTNNAVMLGVRSNF